MAILLREGVFGEETGKQIIADWEKYYNLVKEKYARRIERFNTIMRNTAPIIVLCRYRNKDINTLKHLFAKYYNKTNIVFVNSTQEQSNDPLVINCHTEKHAIWNDPIVWKEGIDKARGILHF